MANTLNLQNRLQGNEAFLEIQTLNATQLNMTNNAELELADDITIVGDLVVGGTFNGATVSDNSISAATITATTSMTTDTLLFPDNETAGLSIQSSDGADYIILKSSDGAEQIQLNKNIYIASSSSSIHGTNSSRGTIQYANIVNSTIAPSCTINANAATATLLQTARSIGGVSFNGSSSINLPGVNQAGNQNTTGTAAAWTSAATTNFTTEDSVAIGAVALSGTGTTTAALKTVFHDQANSSAHKLMITNATSGHTSAALQQQIRFENEYLPSMAQSDDLVGKLTMAKDLFTITQYDTTASNTSTATTFTRNSDTYPMQNGMLRFLQSAAGAFITVQRDGTYNGNADQKALPSGIDFMLGSGAYLGGNLGGLQGGIRSNYTSAEVGNTKVFAAYVAGGAVKEASLTLIPDELSLRNMGILKFAGTAGTVSSDTGNIVLTPHTNKAAVLSAKVRVGDDEDTGNPFIMAIEDPDSIGSGATATSDLLSFKWKGGTSTTLPYNYAFEGTNSGLQLVFNIWGGSLASDANKDAYAGDVARSVLMDFDGNLRAVFVNDRSSVVSAALNLSGRINNDPLLSFTNKANLAYTWYFDVDADFDLNLGGVSGTRNISMSATAGFFANGAAGKISLVGSTDAELTATAGDVKLVSGDDTFITSGGTTTIEVGTAGGAAYLQITGRAEGGIVKRHDTAGTDTYNLGLQLYLPGSTTGGFAIFQNGSTRSADNGTSTATVRNDAGSLALGNNVQDTLYYGKAHRFHNDPTGDGYLYNAGAIGFKRYATAGDWSTTSGASGDKITIHLEQGGIWIKENGAMYMVSSDERVKDEIEIVDDDEALQIILKIETKKYHYKDPKKRRAHKSIGFIAQDVLEHLPTACKLNENIIPDEMRELEDMVWVGNDLYLDLEMEENNTGVVRFYVIDEEKELEQNVKRQLTEEGDAYYTFDKQYDSVFVYGREINDFLGIDKQQIFALHHSGIQELDRKAKAQDEKILSLEAKNVSLETKLKDLIARVSLNELALKSLL